MSTSSSEFLTQEDQEQSVALLSNNMEARAEHQKTKHYQTLYSFTTSIGIGLIILVLFWIFNYRGGLSGTSNPKLEFNWHPLLMVLSLLFLYSQSILLYRSFRTSSKRSLKLLHAILHGLAFILAVLGLKTVFDSHNLAQPPIPNLYTLHSWIGLTTVIIFAGQFLFGFISFLWPGLSKTVRQTVMPVHTAVGTGGFILAIVTIMTGIAEKTIWAVGKKYDKYDPEGILCNVIGGFTVLYGVMVLYLLNEPDYKRISLPEDELVLTENE